MELSLLLCACDIHLLTDSESTSTCILAVDSVVTTGASGMIITIKPRIEAGSRIQAGDCHCLAYDLSVKSFKHESMTSFIR